MKLMTLRAIGALGMLLFVPLFLFTFADPYLIEKSGRAFVEWKLEQEARAKIDSLRLPDDHPLEKLLGERAATLRAETEARLEKVREALEADLPAILAEQIAEMRNLDCECRQKWETYIRDDLESYMASLDAARQKLIAFTQARYMEIVQQLTLDVRIFLGTNAAVFVLLFAISFLKPQAVHHLFLPAILIVISTAICSYFYLFEQNWFYSILYNDYTGFAYIAYILVVFAFLCDIAFNRGRVTTEVLNFILNAIGSALTVVPC